jgi:diguanylate cyclase (GGDEF)-like protein/PAS domain S-box-containing protein
MNKITRASNYELENCLEKLARINRSEFALGFLIDHEKQPNVIIQSSKATISDETILIKDENLLSEHLVKNIFNKLIGKQALYFSKKASPDPSSLLPEEYADLFSNRIINNVRYIPIREGTITYAVVVLINVSFSITTKQLVNVEPFILTAITLLKNRKQHSSFHFIKPSSDSKVVEKQNIAESMLLNTFHPAFIFNDDFKVLKANAASQRLFNSNIDRRWLTIDQLIKKTMPSISSRLLSTISKYFFLGHLDKQKWLNIDFHQNKYQTIKVDLHIFDIQYSGVQCFGLMLNEKLENKATEHDYHESLQRFNALTSVVPMAILQVDKYWNCSYVNETWERYTGQCSISASDKGWLSCLSPVNIRETLPEMLKDTSRAKNYSGEFELTSTDQYKRWVSVHAIGLFNNKYELTGLILTLHDITNSRKQAEKLQKMANYDHLTGLSNRAFFNDRLSVALSRVYRHGITALMFLDLDRFKQINDTLGHPIGDIVIQEIAKRLKMTIRDEDSIARLGGDEFAIIITDVKTEDTLAHIATKIVNAINMPFSIDKHSIPLSCSIGIAISNEASITPTDILRKADLALYKAKDSGRNQFCFYDAGLEKDHTILHCIKESLNNRDTNGFSLVFQPLVNTKTNETIGFEALSRWSHPDYGIVEPDVFIRIIEKNNLIHQFSYWLLNELVSKIKVWLNEYQFIDTQKMSINLSAKQLHLTEFADELIVLFQSEILDPSWFILEVTEAAFIQDPVMARTNLKKLKDAGFLIALDDFGTGYSSLNLLRQMPLNYIKIHHSFIKDILQDEGAEKIVLAIIGLANILKLTVIAEGVERVEIRNWLMANDCNIHQGYYYNPPLKEEDVIILLSSRNLDNITDTTQNSSIS